MGQAIPVTTFSTYDAFGRELTKQMQTATPPPISTTPMDRPPEILHSNGASRNVPLYKKWKTYSLH